MFLENFSKNECCGCSACSRVCAFSAIKMETDEQGYRYPVVNFDLCKDCGMCQKVCPMQENYVGVDADPDVWAVCNKDKDVVSNSSSGGTFSMLADWVLQKNGVIYGVSFDEKYNVYHMRACTKAQADKFRTSKYVESKLDKVFETIESDLKDERTVLLTGTPCQISAVLKYLKVKRVNTDNLYTCDNICHGVPSSKVWKDYIDIIKKKYVSADDEIEFINMRSKKTSWQKQNIEIGLKKGNIDSVVEDFSFNKFFLSLFSNRPSCFNCKYTSYKRVADFTLGDFWNVEQAGVDFNYEGGVNVLLVNTDKGRALFEIIKENADAYKTTKKACWQPHLEYSAKAPAKQEQFWQEYNSASDKEVVIRKYMKGSILTKIIRSVSPILRKTGLYSIAGKMYKVVFGRK